MMGSGRHDLIGPTSVFLFRGRQVLESGVKGAIIDNVPKDVVRRTVRRRSRRVQGPPRRLPSEHGALSFIHSHKVTNESDDKVFDVRIREEAEVSPCPEEEAHPVSSIT